MTDHGFDHTQFRDEVEQRWGSQAYAGSDSWWRSLSADEQQDFRSEDQALTDAWRAAAASGEGPDSADAQELARRHERWVVQSWGGRTVPPDALVGLGQMYVDDERFARHYGGVATATFIRDALVTHAERQP